tara:strand:- start:3900 stop:4061 length:162 start_codon:yes stop_codon:yes gene_type:complete
MYVDCVLFFTINTRNINSENEKKFKKVKLYGGKLNIVIEPKINGAKYKVKNLL